MLHDLKLLELGVPNMHDLVGMATLLQLSPNLETLTLEYQDIGGCEYCCLHNHRNSGCLYLTLIYYSFAVLEQHI